MALHGSLSKLPIYVKDPGQTGTRVSEVYMHVGTFDIFDITVYRDMNQGIASALRYCDISRPLD